ncbi:MAG TPA: hypothetical protein VGC42_24220, partial [Kofleriaceae bacterium]
MRSALVALALLAATTRAIAPASAAPPTVEIRAQTKLVLDKIQLLSDDEADLRGHLVDGLTGDGIGGQRVAIKLGELTATATTERDGSFHTRVGVSPGRQQVELEFRGSQLLGDAQLAQATDPSRTHVGLSLDIEEAA